ncbi:type II toxin-antitoxin system VapC family toxin [Desulfosporosinus lacus]|uniref:type II toxin-antitoxin system VapC family toxin n=1 Tax=Desulfosporosinus lacus TaxID=329936 RepID=UPI001161402F|nr:type II toxin-antitoxin system VapC family toxin [Desulfosporosinus lacus]
MRRALFNQGIKRDEIMFSDCLIASTGVELDAVVLSANRKDFVHLEQFGVKWQNPINI